MYEGVGLSYRTKSGVYSTYENLVIASPALRTASRAMFPAMFLLKQVEQNTEQTQVFRLDLVNDVLIDSHTFEGI